MISRCRFKCYIYYGRVYCIEYNRADVLRLIIQVLLCCFSLLFCMIKFCHVNIHVVIIWLIVLVNCEKFTLTFTVCLTVGLLLLTAYSDRVLHTELRAVCGSHLEPICEWFGVLCVPYWTEFMLFVNVCVVTNELLPSVNKNCSVTIFRVGIPGGWGLNPHFMSTDTRFWVKIGFKFQYLGKISNISTSDPCSFRSVPTLTILIEKMTFYLPFWNFLVTLMLI